MIYILCIDSLNRLWIGSVDSNETPTANDIICNCFKHCDYQQIFKKYYYGNIFCL